MSAPAARSLCSTDDVAEFLVAPQTDLLPLTLALILEELARTPATAKIIVFAPTARGAAIASDVFETPGVAHVLNQFGGSAPFPTFAIHSRRSQSQRVKATEGFAKAPRGVLFSSDVAARGVDFPGVSVVLQVGLPASAEQ